MCAFVVLCLVFRYLGLGNVSEITYFVEWDVKPQLSQST